MSRRSLVCRLLPVLLVFVLAALLLPVWGQAASGKKYALLVGVNRYHHPKLKPLQYAENDATALADVLGKAGYEVVVLTGAARPKGLRPTKANIEARLRQVLRKCRPGDTVVVALAGHGLHFAGKDDSYFCPSDARPFGDETDSLVSLKKVYAELEKSFAGVKLLLVDACRDDPRAGRGSRGIDGDTAPRPPSGVGALFSCRSGQRAFEDDELKHGVFFHYVLKGLRGAAKDSDNEVTFLSLASYVTRHVSRDVPKRMGARQEPSLNARELAGSAVLLALADAGSRPERADSRVERKKKAAKEITNSISMKLVRIPPGKFLMGSPADEKDREPYDKGSEQQHEVEITKAFYLGVTEVTQAQYRAVMGSNPTWFSATGGGKDKVAGMDTDDFPVESVSWKDAQTFLGKLSDRAEEKKKGRKYRLPSEAEWEYACRGGAPSRHPFHFGPSLSSTQANFDGNYPYGGAAKGPYLQRTTTVGSYPTNRFGLRDMHGNVWEWCSDWYDKDYYGRSPARDPRGPARGSSRVIRGGSWFNPGQSCRSASRYDRGPAHRSYDLGFRVALVPSGE
jgi:formylglycine-generating enzyme required for sulfatase activity